MVDWTGGIEEWNVRLAPAPPPHPPRERELGKAFATCLWSTQNIDLRVPQHILLK